jgi:hypothetical protein
MKRILTSLLLVPSLVSAEINPFEPKPKPVEVIAPPTVVTISEPLATEIDELDMDGLNKLLEGDDSSVTKTTLVAVINGEEVWYDSVNQIYTKKPAK